MAICSQPSTRRKNLLFNLRNDLEALSAIMPWDVTVKSFKQRVMSYSDDITERIFNDLVDIQFAIHEHANTIVTLHETNSVRSYRTTAIFSRLVRLTDPCCIDSDGCSLSISGKDLKNICTDGFEFVNDDTVYEIQVSVRRIR